MVRKADGKTGHSGIIKFRSENPRYRFRLIGLPLDGAGDHEVSAEYRRAENDDSWHPLGGRWPIRAVAEPEPPQ